MAMRFTLTVHVEVERVEGKFASRDEIEQQIVEVLQGAQESEFEGDNGGIYEVTGWEVDPQ